MIHSAFCNMGNNMNTFLVEERAVGAEEGDGDEAAGVGVRGAHVEGLDQSEVSTRLSTNHSSPGTPPPCPRSSRPPRAPDLRS